MLVMHLLISLPYLTSGMIIVNVSSAIFAQNSDRTFIISTGQGKLFGSIFFRSIQDIFFSSLWRLSSSGSSQVFLVVLIGNSRMVCPFTMPESL